MSNLIDTIKKKQIIKPRTEVLINALPDFRHTKNTVLNTDVSSPDYGKWQCIASEQADSNMNGKYYTRGSHYYNNDYGDGHYISSGIDVGDGNASGSIRSFLEYNHKIYLVDFYQRHTLIITQKTDPIQALHRPLLEALMY